MKKKLKVTRLSVLIGLMLIGCAKKMLPPSPDRFAPQLLEIEPKTQTRLDLVFNEEILPYTDSIYRFYVTNKTDTFEVISIVSTSSNMLSIYTKPLTPNTQYQIHGWVADRTGNFTVIKKAFKSTSQPDSTGPKIVNIYPKPGSNLKYRKDFYIEVIFSEPVDPKSNICFAISPLYKEKVNYQFSKDYQTLTFYYTDTLVYQGLVYFILLPSITDIANNRLRNLGYTYFTSDSTFITGFARGKISFQNLPIADGIIVFKRGNLKSFTTSNRDGIFSCKLEPGKYFITVIADTNNDFYVDLISPESDIVVDTTQLELPVINLFPATTQINLNEYFK
ncbi:MAG: Ig-like domain-containing protein [candidate division WOR-3 bacterium]|nr:Ig-like domain-containing protein [candidate division WOR-3 bacterium]MCX7757706.1 Ig-like domain-containing protein [candidate division WOR-3 bacterium]MDW7987442.1 Ig-like domain-containing protein [candidate division WOR-3 bacterium]